MGQQSTHLSGTSIPLWSYQRNEHAWLPNRHDRNPEKIPCTKFRVLTYNVWFSEKYQPMRFQSLCDILNQSDAQVIGLQEMTKVILDQLINQTFIRERYYVSDIDGQTFQGWYGVVLLVDRRLNVSQLNAISFPQSNMGRRLLLVEIQLDQNEVLRLGTVHLESLNSKPQRLAQLNLCQTIFNRSPGNCILMGDFNFHAHGQENIEQFQALPNWIDVWKSLMGVDNPGYTFDTENNPMTKLNNQSTDRSRYDRIILRSHSYVSTEIEILGNRSVGKEEHLEIFPSDHFGLTAVFEKKETNRY